MTTYPNGAQKRAMSISKYFFDKTLSFLIRRGSTNRKGVECCQSEGVRRQKDDNLISSSHD
jgi:hypothetical protein